MKAFLGWLDDGSGRVKMVVTSVPFFPDLKSDSDDKWGGFVKERTEILDFILSRKIRKTVFLSGDVHCSFSAELSSPDDPQFKVISIVSSSFFWPYPHMDDGDFILKGELKTGVAHKYTVGKASRVYSEDNYACIDVDPNGLDISFYARKGKQLGRSIRRSF